ncbi:MAG: pyridoxal-phosphate dependent enzyme [Blastocatellia bacterium]
MVSTVTLDQVRAVAEAIKPFIDETPLLRAPELSHLCGGHLFLKAESLQVTGSFKRHRSFLAARKDCHAGSARDDRRRVARQSQRDHLCAHPEIRG